MSAICGIVNFDGAPVDPQVLRKMAEAAAYRGPDGIRYWIDGSFGFAHLALNTTPESLRERQPLVNSRGDLVLVADARVDNRAELIEALTAKGYVREKDPTDADVILAAYECWGTECPGRLIGDFAFAVWDARQNRLFMARDVIGIRQLSYARTDASFSFGTTIGAVAVALPRPPTLNRPLLEDFLVSRLDRWDCETVYTDVHRLPPAHSLSVDANGAARRLYYVLGTEAKPHFSSDREWIEAFRSVLDGAVRCHLRSTTPVGILTGGGLDSSSLACEAHALARRETGLAEVRLYAAVFRETPGADESEYFDAVAASCASFVSTRVPCDQHWALREFGTDRSFPLDEPDVDIFRSSTLALLRTAAGQGCRVVITGDGGDGVLGQELYGIPAVVPGVRLRDIGREIRYYKAHQSWLSLLYRAYLRPALPGMLRGWLRALRCHEEPVPPWVRTDGRCCEGHPGGLHAALLTSRDLSPAARAMLQFLRSPFEMARCSAVDVITAYAGVEWRLPYLDRRVVGFLLHIPHHLRCSRGVRRVILRDAMVGVLPESVRLRRTKSHTTQLIHRGLREERCLIEALLHESRSEVMGLLDARSLREAFESYWRGETDDYRAMRAPLCLEAWLRSGGSRQSAANSI